MFWRVTPFFGGYKGLFFMGSVLEGVPMFGGCRGLFLRVPFCCG